MTQRQSGRLSPTDALQSDFVLPSQAPVTTQQTPSEEPNVRHGFKVGEYGLLVNTRLWVSEVFDQLSICRLPNAPEWLFGVANRRGNIVPVFDLHCMLEQAVPENGTRRFLVLEHGEDAIGVVIYELPSKLQLLKDYEVDNLLPVPDLLETYVRRIYRMDNQTWIDWDIKNFFEWIAKTMA